MNKLSGKPKKILITGGTSGLGYELVKYFVQSGDEVFATGRNASKLIGLEGRIHFIRMELSDLADVRKNILELIGSAGWFDIVINNAGVLGTKNYITTKDGFEYTIQVNFLSHLLVDEIIVRNKLNKEPMTIVSITSPVCRFYRPHFIILEENDHHSFRNYAESKINLLLIGDFLAKKYPGKNLRYFGFDPGVFRSGIFRMQEKWLQEMYRIAASFMRSPQNVAANLVDILARDTSVNGRIYRSKSNYRTWDILNDKPGQIFLAECSSRLEPYFK